MNLESRNNTITSKVSFNESIVYKRCGITCTNVVLEFDDFKSPCSELKQLQKSKGTYVFPNDVVELGDKVFSNKRNIETLDIPTTITKIGDYCFNSCLGLKSLSIPSTVKSIGYGCFGGCGLEKLSVPLDDDNKYPFKQTYDDYVTLKRCNIKCKYTSLYENNLHDSRLNYKGIPTSPDIILDANKKKDNRKSIRQTIPNSNVVSLKYFHLMQSINKFVVPTSVTYLCDDCFKGYDELQTITIPTTVKYIGKHLIDNCVSLTELNYDGDWDNITVSYDDHLRYKLFKLYFKTVEYTNDDKVKYGNDIPLIVNSLHQSYYDRSNETINIPTYITSLDNHMFESTTMTYSKLLNIIIPISIKTIPKYCFSKCHLLTSVELPSTLTSIKKKAFYKCYSLQSIIIPSSVTSIEQYAFDGCYSLSRVILPPTLKNFGNGCFKDCDQLKDNLDVPEHCF